MQCSRFMPLVHARHLQKDNLKLLFTLVNISSAMTTIPPIPLFINNFHNSHV